MRKEKEEKNTKKPLERFRPLTPAGPLPRVEEERKRETPPHRGSASFLLVNRIEHAFERHRPVLGIFMQLIRHDQIVRPEIFVLRGEVVEEPVPQQQATRT